MGCDADLQHTLMVNTQLCEVKIPVGDGDSQDVLYLGENVLRAGTFPVRDLFPRLRVQPGQLVLGQGQTHAALLSADPHPAHRRQTE